MKIEYSQDDDALYIELRNGKPVKSYPGSFDGVNFESYYDEGNKLVGVQIYDIRKSIRLSQLKIEGLEKMIVNSENLR